MNKKVVIGIALMVAVNVATVFYVNRQVFGLQQTVRELRGLAIKLSPEFESKLESDLSAVVEGVKTSTDNTVASIAPAVKSVVNGMERTVADMKLSADNAVAEMTPTMQTAIHNASSNLVEMCRSKVLGNELEAERSYQKAIQALDEGDFVLAKLYCMNAINHSPTKKLYFEKLLEISRKTGDETRDDLEQIKGALELGIFQVAADDVLGMRNMLAAT